MTSANGIGDFIRDPDEAQRRIDQWAQGFAEKAQRYQAAQARTEQLRLSAASSDGAVRVTVGADGAVTDLRFTDRIRSFPLDELSAQILNTMRRAQSGIADQVAEVMSEQLGDEDPQTRSVMLDNLRSRFPDPDADPEPEEQPGTPAPPPAGGGATGTTATGGTGTGSGGTGGNGTGPRHAADEGEDNNPW